MRTILLALVLFVAGCAHNPVAEMHKVAVHLTLDDEVSCSGTIVGKHAVLTAEHCLVGAHKLAIDDKVVEVVKVILDHRDHAIVVVKADFSDWAFIGDEPGQGDDVYILGNPDELRNMFRHGLVAGEQYVPKFDMAGIYIDLNDYPGDSGSGIFNDRGQLVGVVSLADHHFERGIYMKLTVAFPLGFTEKQWQEAHG